MDLFKKNLGHSINTVFADISPKQTGWVVGKVFFFCLESSFKDGKNISHICKKQNTFMSNLFKSAWYVKTHNRLTKLVVNQWSHKWLKETNKVDWLSFDSMPLLLSLNMQHSPSFASLKETFSIAQTWKQNVNKQWQVSTRETKLLLVLQYVDLFKGQQDRERVSHPFKCVQERKNENSLCSPLNQRREGWRFTWSSRGKQSFFKIQYNLSQWGHFFKH